VAAGCGSVRVDLLASLQDRFRLRESSEGTSNAIDPKRSCLIALAKCSSGSGGRPAFLRLQKLRGSDPAAFLKGTCCTDGAHLVRSNTSNRYWAVCRLLSIQKNPHSNSSPNCSTKWENSFCAADVLFAFCQIRSIGLHFPHSLLRCIRYRRAGRLLKDLHEHWRNVISRILQRIHSNRPKVFNVVFTFFDEPLS
jgi:hypothetical protein